MKKVNIFKIKAKNAFQRFQQSNIWQLCWIDKGLRYISISNKRAFLLDGVGRCWTVLDCWIVGRPFCVPV